MALGLTESGAVAFVLLGNISAWAKMIYDARKNGKNGNGKACPLHAGLSQEITTLHRENREEHQKLSDDIHGLSIIVAGAASAAAQAATAAAGLTVRSRRKA